MIELLLVTIAVFSFVLWLEAPYSPRRGGTRVSDPIPVLNLSHPKARAAIRRSLWR